MSFGNHHGLTDITNIHRHAVREPRILITVATSRTCRTDVVVRLGAAIRTIAPLANHMEMSQARTA